MGCGCRKNKMRVFNMLSLRWLPNIKRLVIRYICSNYKRLLLLTVAADLSHPWISLSINWWSTWTLSSQRTSLDMALVCFPSSPFTSHTPYPVVLETAMSTQVRCYLFFHANILTFLLSTVERRYQHGRPKSIEILTNKISVPLLMPPMTKARRRKSAEGHLSNSKPLRSSPLAGPPATSTPVLTDRKSVV